MRLLGLKGAHVFPALSVPCGQSTFDFGTWRDKRARFLCLSLSQMYTGGHSFCKHK